MRSNMCIELTSDLKRLPPFVLGWVKFRLIVINLQKWLLFLTLNPLAPHGANTDCLNGAQIIQRMGAKGRRWYNASGISGSVKGMGWDTRVVRGWC